MVFADKKLKYMFEQVSNNYFYDEDNGRVFKADTMVYGAFKRDEVKGLQDDEWDVIHKDGDFENNHLENLELVVFKDSKFFDNKETLTKLETIIKRNSEEKASLEKMIRSEKITNKFKVDSLNRQIEYERNRVKELNKELNKKEREIRRLVDILNKR